MLLFSSAIQIGFEQPSYVFLEPLFTEKFIDQVFLVKENDQLSEQTFRVEISVSDVSPSNSTRPASLTSQDTLGKTIDNDYRISNPGQRSIVLSFTPNMQSISFNFALFPDLIVEGTEAFMVNAEPELSTPSFLAPIFLSQNTFIIIEDNDSK